MSNKRPEISPWRGCVDALFTRNLQGDLVSINELEPDRSAWAGAARLPGCDSGWRRPRVPARCATGAAGAIDRLCDEHPAALEDLATFVSRLEQPFPGMTPAPRHAR